MEANFKIKITYRKIEAVMDVPGDSPEMAKTVAILSFMIHNRISAVNQLKIKAEVL
jgi:hypothetical protein